jgi:amylosucrase
MIFNSLKEMISIRKTNPVLADHNNIILHYTGNEHILIFERSEKNRKGLLVICNFDEATQVVDGNRIAKLGYLKNQQFHNLITGQTTQLKSGFLAILPYQILWLKKH